MPLTAEIEHLQRVFHHIQAKLHRQSAANIPVTQPLIAEVNDFCQQVRDVAWPGELFEKQRFYYAILGTLLIATTDDTLQVSIKKHLEEACMLPEDASLDDKFICLEAAAKQYLLTRASLLRERELALLPLLDYVWALLQQRAAALIESHLLEVRDMLSQSLAAGTDEEALLDFLVFAHLSESMAKRLELCLTEDPRNLFEQWDRAKKYYNAAGEPIRSRQCLQYAHQALRHSPIRILASENEQNTTNNARPARRGL